jgi:hypothetical protein
VWLFVTGYRMEYDEEELRSMVEWGVKTADEAGYIVKPVFISMKEEVSMLRPFEYIYGKFSYGTWVVYLLSHNCSVVSNMYFLTDCFAGG